MKIIALLTFVQLFFFLTNQLTGQTTVGLLQHDIGTLDDGYVLFAPNTSINTYLIDKCGYQVKTWPSSYKPGQSAYLLSDGTLFRTGNVGNTTFMAGGQGGIVEKIDWNGNVTWSYLLSDANNCQHHDAKVLPNGNVLIIAWELKTDAEAIAKGRNPALVPTTIWSEQILEIQPIGTNGGTIVWEWHLWDHLEQNFDQTKENYVASISNPDLLDINYNASATTEDWIHLNSIDYNSQLDQILISAHNMDEIYIIDHSTTAIQAASHSGGNSGKGGDFLYRWGNPQVYNHGSTSDQKLFGQHNARWIETGLPYENNIMIFNNGLARPGGAYSTVEIINPPINGTTYSATTLPFLPAASAWSYNEGNPNSFYSMNISGAQQLSNGNVLVTSGTNGHFIEVDSNGTKLWEYVNPVKATGIIAQGTSATQNTVFRSTFYPSNYTGFSGHNLTATSILENTNEVSDSCQLILTNGIIELNESEFFRLFPNPANNTFTISLNTNESGKVELFNQLGELILAKDYFSSSIQNIDVSNLNDGIYLVKFQNEKGSLQTQKLMIQKE